MKKEELKKEPFNLEYYKTLQGEEAFKFRLQGLRPVLEIYGHPFDVDIRTMQLRPLDNPLSLGINLNNGGEFDGIKREYTYYYDPRTMSEAKKNPKTDQYPKETVIIKFPDPYRLDPLAMARMNNRPDRNYLTAEPFLMYRVAEVIKIDQKQKTVRRIDFGKHGKGFRPKTG